MSKSKTELKPFASTAAKKDVPDGALVVTPEEMRFLKEWSWGPDAHRVECEGVLDGSACGHTMVFERHPADWPKHPDGVRVKIECPECGHMQFTDGATEKEYVDNLHAELMREVREEVAKRIQALSGDDDVEVVVVSGSDAGGGEAEAGTPIPE